ncbi:hypothetical protein [Hyalangium rubrum]|uniref:Lipoprotein n=1 Tax=Hyalangium rubrum TaxID=3103134 RepID=A0ABU5GYC7_9BACT|nr:hypothetical protein [Hyalangium sp. s54d21]MDY7226206.1 hypothetical protein [Hyalangium sp. s54d21]
MRGRRAGALMLALVMGACASTPRPWPEPTDASERELEAARYELRVWAAYASPEERVEVGGAEFERALGNLVRLVHAWPQPREGAQVLFPSEREVRFAAEVREGQVVWAVPLPERPIGVKRDVARMTRDYQSLCLKEHGESDCLGLLKDGPLLEGEDFYALGMGLALGSVLGEMKQSLRELADWRALLSTVLWAATTYLLLWVIPEPLTKALAAVTTLALLAWLGAETVGSLLMGWVDMVGQVDRASSFEQVRQAGERYGQVMGRNAARVLVLVVAAALGGGAGKLVTRLPQVPGFARAAVQAEARVGVELSTAAAQVESVGFSAERSFSILRMSARRGAGSASSGERQALTLIRHQAGNRQVLVNGQRWNVPRHKSVKDIPKTDPVGDELQAAAERVTLHWSREALSDAEKVAIDKARAHGEHWLGNLLEREARGRFVHRVLERQFPSLRWSAKGIDAVDPRTGYRYELLTGTNSNLERHGRRMAEEFFRMISF